MTRNAATQDYSIGIRGGSKESSYSASIYYKDQKGIVKGGNSKMLGGSFNFDAAVRDIVRFKLDLRATARTANDKDNMIGEILDMRPDVPAYNGRRNDQYDRFTIREKPVIITDGYR